MEAVIERESEWLNADAVAEVTLDEPQAAATKL
jgi:hypothetical protein